jgi:hypothetical protein
MWLLILDVGAGPQLFLLQTEPPTLDAEEFAPGHWITEVTE